MTADVSGKAEKTLFIRNTAGNRAAKDRFRL